MTCPVCHQDGGHYLGCKRLDEEHQRFQWKGLLAFLVFCFLLMLAWWLGMGPADAVPELEERKTMVHSFWQDGFNVPQGYESAEVDPGEVAGPTRRDWPVEVERWRPLVEDFFPGEVELALCVMNGESGGEPSAKNPSGASGLFQIMPFWAAWYGVDYDHLFMPEANVALASALRIDEGWDEWAVYNRGTCS